MNQRRGFKEFEHTADWGIFVWAEDFSSLLCSAAEGMYSLLDMMVEPGKRDLVKFSLPASGSRESLLVDFLNELLYLSERDNLTFTEFSLSMNGDNLFVTMVGQRVVSQAKEIKAVTFHNLEVLTTSKGFEARIVFDV